MKVNKEKIRKVAIPIAVIVVMLWLIAASVFSALSFFSRPAETVSLAGYQHSQAATEERLKTIEGRTVPETVSKTDYQFFKATVETRLKVVENKPPAVLEVLKLLMFLRYRTKLKLCEQS